MNDECIIELMSKSKSNACKFLSKNSFIKELAESEKIKRVYVKSKGKDSENSFCLVCQSDSQVAETLIDIFKIPPNRQSLFKEKFQEAVSGDGQEYNRINRLGSSSLLAFLCFYSVSTKNKLKLNLSNRVYTFYDVHFECRNHIDPAGDKCSNIDVLLLGENDEAKPTALFLESKFSEYFSRSSKVENISASYQNLYGEFGLFASQSKKWSSLTCERSHDNTLRIRSIDNATHYCNGIKQLISHYRGLKTICQAPYNRQTEYGNPQKMLVIKGDMLLGTILYDFGDFDKRKNLEDYANLYKDQFTLAFPKTSGIQLVKEILTYNKDVATSPNFKIDPIVRKFYCLDGKQPNTSL